METIAEELEVLRTRRAAAIFDVELQLRLKQGQVIIRQVTSGWPATACLPQQVPPNLQETSLCTSQPCVSTPAMNLVMANSLRAFQVECSPAGVTASVPDALLVGKDQVTALNSSILAKGNAKLDLMKQMKEFKRGIYQLEWENKKFEMEVSACDVTAILSHAHMSLQCF